MAAVSPSTVSRGIAGNPRISEATRRRVLQAMNRLGYRPNAIACSLVTRTSRTLGIVLYRPADRALAHPFFAEALRGMASAAEAAATTELPARCACAEGIWDAVANAAGCKR